MVFVKCIIRPITHENKTKFETVFKYNFLYFFNKEKIRVFESINEAETWVKQNLNSLQIKNSKDYNVEIYKDSPETDPEVIEVSECVKITDKYRPTKRQRK